MIRAPPRSTRTDTLCPYTTLFRSPCARLDAIGADAGLRDVQINLHDPPLAPDFLDQAGEPDLWNLADIARPAAALPQEDILRGLLADGRTAAEFLALGVAFDSILDRGGVRSVERRSVKECVRQCRSRWSPHT